MLIDLSGWLGWDIGRWWIRVGEWCVDGVRFGVIERWCYDGSVFWCVGFVLVILEWWVWFRWWWWCWFDESRWWGIV